MNHRFVKDLGILNPLAQRLSRHGKRIGMNFGLNGLKQRSQTASSLEIFHQMGTVGFHSHEQGYSIAGLIEEADAVKIIQPGFGRHGRNMNEGVCRAAHGHTGHDGVLNGILGNNIPSSNALIPQFHYGLACAVSHIMYFRISGANCGVSGHSHTQRFCNNAHGIGSPHHGTGAGAGTIQDFHALIHSHAARLNLTNCSSHIHKGNLLSIVITGDHISAGYDHSWNVQASCGHDIGGNNLITAGHQDHGIHLVAFDLGFNFVCDQVSAGKDILGAIEGEAITQSNGRKMIGRTACLNNSLFHIFCKVIKVAVSIINITPGTDNGNLRSANLGIRLSNASQQSIALCPGNTKGNVRTNISFHK